MDYVSLILPIFIIVFRSMLQQTSTTPFCLLLVQKRFSANQIVIFYNLKTIRGRNTLNLTLHINQKIYLVLNQQQERKLRNFSAKQSPKRLLEWRHLLGLMRSFRAAFQIKIIEKIFILRLQKQQKPEGRGKIVIFYILNATYQDHMNLAVIISRKIIT